MPRKRILNTIRPGRIWASCLEEVREELGAAGEAEQAGVADRRLLLDRALHLPQALPQRVRPVKTFLPKSPPREPRQPPLRGAVHPLLRQLLLPSSGRN